MLGYGKGRVTECSTENTVNCVGLKRISGLLNFIQGSLLTCELPNDETSVFCSMNFQRRKRRRSRLRLSILAMSRAAILALALIADSAHGCTVIAVGKDAGGGTAFLAHTDDAGGGTQDGGFIFMRSKCTTYSGSFFRRFFYLCISCRHNYLDFETVLTTDPTLVNCYLHPHDCLRGSPPGPGASRIARPWCRSTCVFNLVPIPTARCQGPGAGRLGVSTPLM